MRIYHIKQYTVLVYCTVGTCRESMPELGRETPSFSTDKLDIEPAGKRQIVTRSTSIITEQTRKDKFGWEK